MKVAINSPSLNVNINISGVSSLVNTIIEHNKGVHYIHLVYGKADSERGEFYKRVSEILGSYKHLFKLLKNDNFDLFHFNLVLYPKSIYRDVITFAITKAFKKGIIIHLNGGTYLHKKPKNLLTTRLIKYMLNKADKVIALTRLEKDALAQLYHTTAVAILPNTVDTMVFKPTGSKADTGNIKFLFLGRLHESKGLQLLITAFEALINKGYDAELVICGDGHLRDYVQAKAREVNAIKFMGVIAGQQRIEVINESDVFVLPSLYGEGIPLALLEAMACGLVPVVSTDGSMREIIENGSNGLLVKINDLNSLTEAMERVVKDKSLRESIAKKALATVRDNYNWDNYLVQLNNLYDEALT